MVRSAPAGNGCRLLHVDGPVIPGFQFIQDPVEYDSRTHGSVPSFAKLCAFIEGTLLTS